ncbi:putative protein KIAA0825 [Dissostichus eleginoides]|uniref:Uncharacterized protein n=1 Tax=Dissostichus eleginoides TaxID=100907 RepID=A0AAD9C296_DISEL|nr:putative protein KIAA0825 [Dissostichus eleginoides]
MEWPGDFPEDHAFVDLLVPGVSSELDFEQLLKDTEEKLNLNANSVWDKLRKWSRGKGNREMEETVLPTPVKDSNLFVGQIFIRWESAAVQGRVGSGAVVYQEKTSNEVMGPFDGGDIEFSGGWFGTDWSWGLFERDLPAPVASNPPHLLIEQQLKELQAKMGESRERPPSPSECLQWFNLRANSFRPVPTGHQDLMDFFRALIQYLRSEEEGKEEVTLQLLLNLSSQYGIQEAWDDVRLQLRRHLLERLSARSPDHQGPRNMSVPERLHCLQQLFFLYPESEALTYYQSLRSQSVLALLHSTLSSSPGDEAGFDRLAEGFRSVVPALTQALTEEIHVLSRLAEPHTILGFLNVAYLSTVTRALASLMEGESETALRVNTSLTSKIKKYSARSRATVAPMELPMKSRSFSLTSHQLKALTHLACTLLGFERTVMELVTNLTFIDCTGETPSVKGILKRNREDLDMTPDCKKSTAETLVHTPEAQVLEFDWRSAFKGLVPHMAHCVKVVLDEFCGAIMTEMDALLPLAAACRDSSLLEVRSSFVEACSRAVLALLGRLQERALEVPSSAPLRNLPALLATCIYVQQRLEHYHARLKDSHSTAAKVPLTLLPIQKYKETAEAFREQLTSYCIQICSTCVFQDAESHHWADPQPFHEGERCSFSVQMWFYFLCGLRSDLWAILPAEMAKEVLGQVLSETLQLLVQRYARARPSYKRHLQIRCDITAVLLYVEQLMWSVCKSPEALWRSNPSSAIAIIAGGSDWPYQIHSLCEQLLTVLVIVTAPLSLLYRMLMNNPGKESKPQHDSPVVLWLNAINPDLFTEQAIRDGLVGQTASLCQLRLLTSDPGHNPRLLLRMLLYRDCHLPTILLENSYICQENSLEMSTDSCKAGDDFIVALFKLFSCLNNVPKALTQSLQPYLERSRMWEHLYTLADTTRAVPVVISCVRAIVTKSIHSILIHLVSMVIGWQATEEPSGALFKQNVPESILAKIPKEWNYTPLEARGKETATKTGISVTIQALSLIFTNLPLAVASIPLPIRYLFQVAEKHLSQHARQLRLMGLLLWALLGCLIQGLEDPDTLEEISGLALTRGAKEPCPCWLSAYRLPWAFNRRAFPNQQCTKCCRLWRRKDQSGQTCSCRKPASSAQTVFLSEERRAESLN